MIDKKARRTRALARARRTRALLIKYHNRLSGKFRKNGVPTQLWGRKPTTKALWQEAEHWRSQYDRLQRVVNAAETALECLMRDSTACLEEYQRQKLRPTKEEAE